MRIPDYEILWKCGHGAYGEVWIARNRAGSLVALKTIAKSEQIEKELAGLRNYSRIADSPHLIRIFHIGEAENTLYYTMELADNLGTEELYIPATLTNQLKQKKRFTPAETVELGTKLLAGLEALYQAKLIHRDVKPENILFVNREPKLSDIGLVRSASQSLSLGGTLGFIPPERLKSGSSGKSCADDLYALGKVLYCCLTGNNVDDYPSFPASLVNDEYRHLNTVILTACSTNGSLRFKSVEEFRNALKDGIPHKKRLWATLLRLRYVLLAGAAATALWGGAQLLNTPSPLPPEPEEEPLKLGEIRNRTYFSMSAEGADGFGVSQTDYIDPVLQKYPPQKLDFPPRSQEVVFNQFRSEKWETISSKGFAQEPDNLTILANPEGGVRLMVPLDFAYAIRFEIDYAKLNERITFQIAALNAKGYERSYYQWSLTKSQGALALKPLEYQPENNERKLQIKPKHQPKDTPGFHQVEMIQTSTLFRLYIDGKLLLYAPSLFMSGYFAIFAEGGRSNNIKLKNLEVLKIVHDPKCPPEKRYQLPNERR